jgi:hypothetical protein
MYRYTEATAPEAFAASTSRAAAAISELATAGSSSCSIITTTSESAAAAATLGPTAPGVGLYKSNLVYPELETAWFQPSKL